MEIMINFDPHTPSCRASYTIIMAKYIFLLSGASCPVTLSGATAHQRQPFLTHFQVFLKERAVLYHGNQTRSIVEVPLTNSFFDI